ncbi:MAG: hypothetical protein V4487_02520 [Chlamydiota bacterium]
MCIDDNFICQEFINSEISTEDEQFRALDFNGILIEIRAFDTSFFEIYSEDEGVIKKISNKFNSKYFCHK